MVVVRSMDHIMVVNRQVIHHAVMARSDVPEESIHEDLHVVLS